MILVPAGRSQLSKYEYESVPIDYLSFDYIAQLPYKRLHAQISKYVNVVKIQHLLGDKFVVPEMIWDAIYHPTINDRSIEICPCSTSPSPVATHILQATMLAITTTFLFFGLYISVASTTPTAVTPDTPAPLAPRRVSADSLCPLAKWLRRECVPGVSPEAWREAWLILIRGIFPWSDCTQVSLFNIPMSTSVEDDLISWNRVSLLQFWQFLLDLRQSGSLGALGVSLHTVKLSESNSDDRRRVTNPTDFLPPPSYFKIYHDASRSFYVRKAVDSRSYQFGRDGTKSTSLRGAKFLLMG